MAYSTTITSSPPAIDITAFNTLTSDILDSLVTDTNSPFKVALDKFTEHIDSNPELDEAQRAGLLADFLRDSYTQINQQAISAALDLLKTNEELYLQAFKVEAEYNIGRQQYDKLVEDTSISAAQVTKIAKEEALIDEQIKQAKAAILESQAKLKKQYGYATDFTTWSLSTDNANGAVDKQIRGYDLVNYKDAMKSIQETTALLTNANTVPPTWMGESTKQLIGLITDNVVTPATAVSYFAGTETSVTVEYGDIVYSGTKVYESVSEDTRTGVNLTTEVYTNAALWLEIGTIGA